MHGAASARNVSFQDYLEEIRTFTREVLRPAEETVEREDAIPADIVDAMRRIGLFAITLPHEYGGLGWTMEQQALLTMEFTQASAVYRSRFSTTIGLTSQVILDYGTDAQRKRYLPAMASGAMTGAFCLTEEAAGSDAGAVETRAVRDGDAYVITGTKRYITNAPDADVFMVVARTGEGEGADALSCLLVERGTPGLSTPPHDRMMGQRGSHVGEVHFAECRVPVSALVGGAEGNGLKKALRGINHARTHVGATCVGQALRLLDEGTAYLLERQQFGKPIGEFQAMQVLLGESQSEVLAARALVLEAARGFDRGPPIPIVEIACAKLFASEMVSKVADRVVQMLGGQGYLEQRAVARLYRDVRLFRIFEGTSQIQQTNIARAVLRNGRPFPLTA
ncbi:acyl-CoA dehydrogenase family protein [Xanthobacter sp. KR7-225]|uniref:acyl-CoA dehydrogenase family protein n=1 Tax=Xanthobacter sp. KR7-225 TaxID=3156613 RepID=UPI0032B46900